MASRHTVSYSSDLNIDVHRVYTVDSTVSVIRFQHDKAHNTEFLVSKLCDWIYTASLLIEQTVCVLTHTTSCWRSLLVEDFQRSGVKAL